MKHVPVLLVTAALLGLGACSGDPTLGDLPPDIASARPDITVEEAKFVLGARDLGVDVTAQSLDEDLENAKTVCWALEEGDVPLGDIARELTADDALRTKRVIKAGIESLCPDQADQLDVLDLPE